MELPQLKIIFAGSVGAGKSTSIHAVSDIEPFQTEEIATDETRHLKRKTTVGMDYGRMNLDETTSIQLYGAPGQERFEFMREILGEGALGVIILINNATESPLDQLDRYLKTFSAHMQTRSIVVGITFTDVKDTPSLPDYRNFLKKTPDSTIPVFTLDARNSDMVRTLVKTLIYRIDPSLSLKR
ncbi:MAG: ATP/GTP-binding protein [Xanthomonadales bacterium]|nr:ATP/GTP-binding protein [Xanthomonadales bacterium]